MMDKNKTPKYHITFLASMIYLPLKMKMGPTSKVESISYAI